MSRVGASQPYASGPTEPVGIIRPSLGPDADSVVFSFKVGLGSWRIGILSLRAKPNPLLILPLPELNWIDPAVSADGNFLAVVSFCAGAGCAPVHQGYNVWKYPIVPKSVGQQLTPPSGEVRRRTPMFSVDGQSIGWVTEATQLQPGLRTLEQKMVVYHNGKEAVLVPPGALGSTSVTFADIAGPQYLGVPSTMFVGRYFGGQIRLANEPGAIKGGAEFVLLQADGRDISAIQKVDALAIGVPKNGGGYIYVRSIDPAHKYDPALFEICEVRGGADRLRFRFAGRGVRDISVSDDFGVVAFGAQRGRTEVQTIWLHRAGEDTAIDLGVPEVVRQYAK